MKKPLCPLSMLTLAMFTWTGCGGRDVPSGWGQGPESIPVEICPRQKGEPERDRRAMLAAVDIFRRHRFEIHSVDTSGRTVTTGYGLRMGVLTAWRFQVEDDDMGRLSISKTSPEHIGLGLANVEQKGKIIARSISSHSCTPIADLERGAALAGVVLPKVIPEAPRNEAPQDAAPASERTDQAQASLLASEESTPAPDDSADAGPRAP